MTKDASESLVDVGFYVARPRRFERPAYGLEVRFKYLHIFSQNPTKPLIILDITPFRMYYTFILFHIKNYHFSLKMCKECAKL